LHCCRQQGEHIREDITSSKGQETNKRKEDTRGKRDKEADKRRKFAANQEPRGRKK